MNGTRNIYRMNKPFKPNFSIYQEHVKQQFAQGKKRSAIAS